MTREPDGLGRDRSLPYMTGLSAQRWIEMLALRVAPALVAAAIVYTRVDSEWQALLVFASLLAVSTILRRPGIPYHLVPLASGAFYLLAPPIGAALAIGVSEWDGYAVSRLDAGDLLVPVLSAWAVTAIGGWVTYRFRRDREVRLAVIGSHEFARGLEAELEAVGVHGYTVVGCIDPETACSEPARAGVRCLGSSSVAADDHPRSRHRAARARPLDPAGRRRPVRGRRHLAAGCLRARRGRLPRPAGLPARGGAALRAALRARAARHHELRMVPVPAASPLPGERALLEAAAGPRDRHCRSALVDSDPARLRDRDQAH